MIVNGNVLVFPSTVVVPNVKLLLLTVEPFNVTVTFDVLKVDDDVFNSVSSEPTKFNEYVPADAEYVPLLTLSAQTGAVWSTSILGPYTFSALVSSVVDAPIKAITGLLNFEIFGVNLKSFMLSLFTLAVVIAIVKLFLGNVGGSSAK